MTVQKALKAARQLWGPSGAVKLEPNGARIGAHGEYLPGHVGNNRRDDPRHGMYHCQACSSMGPDGDGNIVERKVWHPIGGYQTAYKIGVIALGMFFEVRAEGESFEACFANVRERVARVSKEFSGLRP